MFYAFSMKIYTKTGDDGTTGLIGGVRVAKSDPRIECYGTVDELNAAIGLAAVIAGSALLEQLRAIQSDLFTLGSHLAVPEQSSHRDTLPRPEDSMITRLENQIDATTAGLPPLRNFILPGGGELAARLHLCRTICRRAERLVVAMPSTSTMAFTVRYLNRLSDWLFVQARQANVAQQITDVIWRANERLLGRGSA